MISQLETSSKSEIIYPDSDGKPMSDNTVQFRWITTIKFNLEWLFADDNNVFIAGDLLWYPVEGNNKLCQAPDVMVALGRPKGDRGSYQQWKEENIAPQVVFEILSPGNTQTEMNKKLVFYETYGVEEYYIYDPDKNDLSGWLREENRLKVIESLENWVSPHLGIRFELTQPELRLYYPNNEPFTTFVEIARQLQQSEAQLEEERQRAEQERQRAEQERQRAEQERQRAERLAAKLQELGINSEEIC